MKIKIFKKGFNYSQDGPGNRLVFHMQGCNMHCPWCANPEGMTSKGESTEIHELEEEAEGAQRLMFGGGGVTFTGGEPTVQFEPLKKFLKLLQLKGINTAVETNASHPKLFELFELIDYLIIDFKHYDSVKHKKETGIDNDIIKSNIEKACVAHKNVLIRTVLIKDFNANSDDLNGFLDFYAKLNVTAVKFELLPYHEYGRVKWEKLGLKYNVQNVFVSDEAVKQFQCRYKERGLQVVTT